MNVFTRRARTAVLVASALVALTTVVASPASQAKTTKKASAKRASTTKKTTAKKAPGTATTAKPSDDQGPAKNIVGTEVAPGAPIKIGLLASTGAEQFTGDVPAMYEIAFDSLRKSGELPVHGRDVVLYFRGVNPFSPDPAAATRAACTALTQDDKVFAAVTWASLGDCLAENKIPTVAGNGLEEAVERNFPSLFVTAQSGNNNLRNVAPWADSLGLLKGRKLGVYHGNTPARQRAIDEQFEPGFKKLGYTIAEDLSGNTSAAGGDPAADRVAVQRFKAAGVDTIFLMSATPADFAKAAVAQGYKPRYIFANNETALVCDGCPARLGLSPQVFDGVYALGGGHVGENGHGGNPPPPPTGLACGATYEKLSGERVRQLGTSGEQQKYQSVQFACDQARVIITALKAAGPNLTQGALINALETSIKGIKSGWTTDISFSRTDHFGSHQLRTLQLEGECLCWKVRSPLREPFVD